jgi:hypothetical protein
MNSALQLLFAYPPLAHDLRNLARRGQEGRKPFGDLVNSSAKLDSDKFRFLRAFLQVYDRRVQGPKKALDEALKDFFEVLQQQVGLDMFMV